MGGAFDGRGCLSDQSGPLRPRAPGEEDPNPIGLFGRLALTVAGREVHAAQGERCLVFMPVVQIAKMLNIGLTPLARETRDLNAVDKAPAKQLDEV